MVARGVKMMDNKTLEKLRGINIRCMTINEANWVVEKLPEILEHIDSQKATIDILNFALEKNRR
jgi:hypothetical protein